jgi:hypothetical protein
MNTREEDMELHVLAVLAAIGCKSPSTDYIWQHFHAEVHSCFESKASISTPAWARSDCQGYHGLLYGGVGKDVKQEALGGAFVSASTDFWSDPHWKEQFGTLVIDLTAYEFEVEGCDEYYFMSKETQ